MKYPWHTLCATLTIFILIPLLSEDSFAQTLPNDECINAIAVSALPYSIMQNTRLATPNPSDPPLACAGGGGGKTVWFSYAADMTRYVTFTTNGSQPCDYDIAMGLYTGTCGSLVEVACNDDIVPGVLRASEIRYLAQAGTAYIIQIAEWNGGGPSGGNPTGGDLLFRVCADSCPPIPNPGGAIPLGPRNGSVPSGAMTSTDFFPYAPALVKQQVQEIPLRPLDPPRQAPGKIMLPKGPEGSNYIEDRGRNTLTSTAGRPVVLQNFQGIPQTAFLPPDPVVATGPNHVLACVNSTFRIWDKNGTVLKTINLSSWFANVRSGLFFSDPRVIYDHFANRWVMVGIDAAQSTTPILISVSDDDNPIGVWYNWALPGELLGDSTTTNFSDHPKLGFDDQALYITSREFSGARQYSKLRIVGKAQLYANTGGPVAWKDFWNFGDFYSSCVKPDFLEPAITFGSPGVEFLVNSSPYTPGTYFTIWRVTNPLTSPSITLASVPVVAYTDPTSAPAQLGGATTFGGGGSALWGIVVYRDSSLWAVHSVANPTNNVNSALHYMRFNPFTNSNLEDVVMGLHGYWHFYPEIMPDAQKNLVITFSRSSASEYVGAYLSGRLNTDPPGLSPSVLLKVGQAFYGGSRWGDYMGITLDPSDTTAVWAFTEYAATPAGNWGTWVGKVKMQPVFGSLITISPTSLNFGTLEVGDTSSTSSIEIGNSGSDTLVISGIVVSSSNFMLVNPPSLPLRIPTYQSTSFGVAFVPHSAASFTDSLIISSNDTSHPTATVRLTATGFVVNPAVRGVMYATTGVSAASRLFTVDTSTAATTPVGPYGSYTQVVSARVHPTTHDILGLVPSGSNHFIVRINSSAGDAHYISTIPLSTLKGMAFRGDTLYVGRITGALYRVDINTGTATLVTTTSPVVNIAGIAFNPLTGELWASSRAPSPTPDRIYKISLPSGAATLVGSTGRGATADIIFDGNGKLYGIIGTGTSINSLIRIDTTNASSSVVGSMGIASVQALAMYPDSLLVGVREIASPVLPTKFSLDQNYPNPFNPTTQITYSVPVPSRVSLKIFNILGQEVATLVEGEQAPGFFVAEWNGTNGFNTPVTSGLYFYSLQATGSDGILFRQIKKMLLLK